VLEYLITEEDASPTQYRLSLNRRSICSFSSEQAAVNTARSLAATDRAVGQQVIISVRTLDGQVRVLEASMTSAPLASAKLPE
jgi:hypothetical protein